MFFSISRKYSFFNAETIMILQAITYKILYSRAFSVNGMYSLAHPQFFLARDRGKSPPRLHKARVEVNGIKASMTFNLALPA